MFLGHMVRTEQLQCVREVDHLRNRGRLFERVIAERERDSRHLTVKLLIGLRRAAGDDLRLALGRRVLDTNIEAAPSYGVAQPAFFIAGEYDEGDALRRDGS